MEGLGILGYHKKRSGANFGKVRQLWGEMKLKQREEKSIGVWRTVEHHLAGREDWLRLGIRSSMTCGGTRYAQPGCLRYLYLREEPRS